MTLQPCIVFVALFLTANAVPARKSSTGASSKVYDTTFASVPVPRSGALGESHEAASTLSARNKYPNTMPFDAAFTPSPVSFDDHIPPGASERPSGVGSCASCAVENFNLVNEYRTAMGVTGVAWSNVLAEYAVAWSRRMYKSGVFEHSDLPFWENIAWNYNLYNWTTAGSGFFEEWRNSPVHEANMKLATHKCMAVGIFGDGKLLYATQMFSNRCPWYPETGV